MLGICHPREQNVDLPHREDPLQAAPDLSLRMLSFWNTRQGVSSKDTRRQGTHNMLDRQRLRLVDLSLMIDARRVRQLTTLIEPSARKRAPLAAAARLADPDMRSKSPAAL